MSQLYRDMVWLATFPLPDEKRIAIDRRLRGRAELRMLSSADAAIVSFGKSGRTWLRVMVSRFYQVRHGFPERALITFDDFHRKNPAVPRILFTHDNYLEDVTGNRDSKADYDRCRVVFLARHPADVAVSQFFQWKFRMKPRKKKINDYPPHGSDISIYDFAMGPSGLGKIIAFMNLWATEAGRLGDQLLLIRYEDMRAETARTLGRVMDFLGTPGTEEEIREAVEFASFENMKKLEQKRTFWLSGSRMVAKDKNNPQSFKVRRGKVGGYRDYFEAAEQARIDQVISATLSPLFGYTDE